MGFGGLGFWGLGVDLGFGIWGVFGFWDFGMFWGLGFWDLGVQGLRFRVWGFGARLGQVSALHPKARDSQDEP